MLLYEESDEKIYNDLNMNIIIGDVNSILYTVLKVDKIIEFEGEYCYSFKFSNKIKGIIKGVKPILLLPKARNQVRFSGKVGMNNCINDKLDITNELSSSSSSRIVFSTIYATYDGELYEGLLYGNQFLGFVPSHTLSILQRLTKEFQINNGSIVFLDSKLRKQAGISKNDLTVYKSEFFIASEDIVRFIYEKKRCWIPVKDTSLGAVLKKHSPTTINEALFSSVAFQLNKKLTKSHSYYLKILKRELKKVDANNES